MLLKQSRCHWVLAGADLVASGTQFGIHGPVKSHIIKSRTKGGRPWKLRQEEKRGQTSSALSNLKAWWNYSKLPMTRIARGGKREWMAQWGGRLWVRRVSTTEICLQFSECASKVTSFKEWLEYPDGGCDCLDSSEDKPSLGNECAKLHSPTRWERAAGVCSCGCLCVCVKILRILFLPQRARCYLYFLSPSSSPSSLCSQASFIFFPISLFLLCSNVVGVFSAPLM